MNREQLRQFAETLKCPDGWWVCRDDDVDAMTRQLGKELLPGHVLWGRRCVAVMRTGRSDDVLYWCGAPGPALALVHLTWDPWSQPRPGVVRKGKPSPLIPFTETFESAAAWNAFDCDGL